MSLDAHARKTHTNHIINNTKTNNQGLREAIASLRTSTRMQRYCENFNLQIFLIIF